MWWLCRLLMRLLRKAVTTGGGGPAMGEALPVFVSIPLLLLLTSRSAASKGDTLFNLLPLNGAVAAAGVTSRLGAGAEDDEAPTRLLVFLSVLLGWVVVAVEEEERGRGDFSPTVQYRTTNQPRIEDGQRIEYSKSEQGRTWDNKKAVKLPEEGGPFFFFCAVAASASITLS